MKVALLSSANERATTYARLLRATPGVDLINADEVFAPEAVVVISEPVRRRELVEEAAEAGARVLCEAPLAAKETDAQAMVDACAAAGVRLTLASPACFSPAFAMVRTAIDGGDVIGRLTTLRGTYNPVRPATQEAEGALGANAPYLLDLVDATLDGESAVEVYAQTNSVLSGRPGAESAALVSVRYGSGIVAALDCGWGLSADQPGAGGPAMTFIGDRASVEFDTAPRTLGGFDVAAGRERWELGGIDLYSVMLDDFLAGRGNGPDGAAGVRSLRIIEAAYESARTGQPVDIA
ncbi:MAG TPA: Gfo/Idh/MocA family oxidoreductase [Pseudonocardiaceae bacterium]|jgi:predicted dehydrogenase